MQSTSAATIIGPLVGQRGSLSELVLQRHPRGWRGADARRPPRGADLTAEEVAAALACATLIDVSLCCPSCHAYLTAKLPAGVTTVRCAGCAAGPLHVTVPPPEGKAPGGRKRASHKAPPLNPRREGRAPTAYNLFMQERVREKLAAALQAGERITSQAAWQQAAADWPTVREAQAQEQAARRLQQLAQQRQPAAAARPASRGAPAGAAADEVMSEVVGSPADSRRGKSRRGAAGKAQLPTPHSVPPQQVAPDSREDARARADAKRRSRGGPQRQLHL